MIDWSEDAPKCPYCGVQFFDPVDMPGSLRHGGNSTEVECDSCGRTTKVYLSLSYTYGVEEKK
jgi:hypothetical protein